jgi:hypothetical protein
MELTQILIIVGVIGGIILAVVAIRGSFKDDDAFYGESPTMPTRGPGDVNQGPVPGDGDGGANASGGGTEDAGSSGDGD